METVLFSTQIRPRGDIDNHRGEVTSKPESQKLPFPAQKMRSTAISVDGTMVIITPYPQYKSSHPSNPLRIPDISVCGTPLVHHKTVVRYEPAWTVTAASPVDRFIPSSQRRHSCFLTSTSHMQQRSVDADIPEMEEE